MNPGVGAIFVDPQSEETNVPPVGNDRGWKFAQQTELDSPQVNEEDKDQGNK